MTAQSQSIQKKIKLIFDIPEPMINDKNPVPPITTPPAQCECVKYYLCKGTNMNIYGEAIIDVK